jgi:hypothetical protein
MLKFKLPKALILKLNLKRVIPLLFMSIMVFFIPVGMAMAESQQNLQSEAALDGNIGVGKGMGLWILFTLAISFGLNNYLRKRENNPENNKG